MGKHRVGRSRSAQSRGFVSSLYRLSLLVLIFASSACTSSAPTRNDRLTGPSAAFPTCGSKQICGFAWAIARDWVIDRCSAGLEVINDDIILSKPALYARSRPQCRVEFVQETPNRKRIRLDVMCWGQSHCDATMFRMVGAFNVHMQRELDVLRSVLRR